MPLFFEIHDPDAFVPHFFNGLLNPIASDSAQALREKNERLRAEVAYLKKVACLDPVKEISCADKALLIAGLRQHHKLADLLHLARSTFYYHGHVTERADRQSAMEVRIRGIYDEHKGRYGYRRTRQLCAVQRRKPSTTTACSG